MADLPEGSVLQRPGDVRGRRLSDLAQGRSGGEHALVGSGRPALFVADLREGAPIEHAPSGIEVLGLGLGATEEAPVVGPVDHPDVAWHDRRSVKPGPGDGIAVRQHRSHVGQLAGELAERPRQEPGLPVGRNVVEQDEPTQDDAVARPGPARQRRGLGRHAEHRDADQIGPRLGTLAGPEEAHPEPSRGVARAVVMRLDERLRSLVVRHHLDAVPRGIDRLARRPVAVPPSAPTLGHRDLLPVRVPHDAIGVN